MKRICLLALLFALVLPNVGSAQLLGKKKNESPAPSDNADNSTIVPGTETPQQPQYAFKKNTDSLFVSLERTPCFGHCPTYKIEIYYKGYVAYHGYNYVDHVGDFYTKVSKDQLRQLFDNAKEIKFFNFKDSYINTAISDFPTTIVTMQVRGQRKTIIDGHNETPSELIFFEKMIDDMFKDTQWKIIKQKDQPQQ